MRHSLSLAGLLFPLLCFAAAAPRPPLRTFQGEIADTQCATNVHSLSRSHKEMLAKYKFIGNDAASCVRYCVHKGGGDFVLQSGNVVYQLADQDRFDQYAGQQVAIRGRLDPKTHLLTAETVKTLPQRRTPAAQQPAK